jgi:hypothetical protein
MGAAYDALARTAGQLLALGEVPGAMASRPPTD